MIETVFGYLTICIGIVGMVVVGLWPYPDKG